MLNNVGFQYFKYVDLSSLEIGSHPEIMGPRIYGIQAESDVSIGYHFWISTCQKPDIPFREQ